MLQSWNGLKKRWAEERAGRKALADQRRRALAARGPAIFARYGICRAVVFGSVTAARCRGSSDLDLLVLPLANQDYWDFRRELEEALGFPVDLYTDRDDPTFVEKILARGETVYEVQP
jgi:predicted nucleotidyltransferase